MIDRARGVWVWNVEGRKYLDFLAAYSALNQGHCHPKIVAALKEQADRVTLTSRAFLVTSSGRCAPSCATSRATRVLSSMNSWRRSGRDRDQGGAGVVLHGQGVPEDRGEDLALAGNFYGRTTTIVGFSSEEQYREGVRSVHARVSASPLRRRRGGRAGDHAGDGRCPGRADSRARAGSSARRGFLRRLRELATAHRFLLAVDEIQSGLGRTGKLFCFEHEGIRPDIVVIGKALGGGCVPISGILADDEVMGVFAPGDHGSTFGGSRLPARWRAPRSGS